MTGLVTSFASKLALRSSRRGFLAASGKLMLAAVGGTTLLTLTAQPAAAQCRCASPCPGWYYCGCGSRGNRVEIHWQCPGCGNYRCEWYECSGRICGRG
jgi:hypothetical protein